MIIHQNIQCITNKIQQLDIFLSDHNADVLLLSEHWQSDDQIDLINLQNFNLCASFNRQKQKHGGVAIFCRNNIKIKHLDHCNDLSLINIFECCGVEIRGYDIVVIVVYRPPNGDINIFLEQFGKLLDMFLHSNKFLVIGGDFNIDFNVSNTALRELLNVLNCNNMCLTIHEPTRVTPTSSKCIDNIIINDREVVSEANIIKNNLSDHFAQYITVSLNRVAESDSHYRRFFNDNSIANFCTYLKNTSWDEVWATQECNTAFNSFMDTILYYFEICFPISKINKRNNSKPHASKKSPEIIAARNKVQLFADLSRKYSQFKEQYKIVNNEYRQLLSSACIKRNDQLVAKAKNKGKAMWTIINNSLGKSKKTKMQIEIEDSGKILNPTECTEAFNNFFITASKNAVANISKDLDQQFLASCLKPSTNSLFLSALTEEDVLELINKLKNSNSSGVDEISNTLLKIIGVYIVRPLTYIINLSLEQGTYPEKLKISNVIPLLKKGNPNLLINYRGISLSPSVSKIFESAINMQLIHFLTVNNMLSQSQHGFTKQKSIDSALSEFVNDIVSTLDKSEIAMGLFVDFSKAFDCVDHSLLLAKLEKYGVRGIVHDWFNSYLSNRFQQVKINDSLSSLAVVNTGVPQGSILGPTLFVIFINDMLNYIDHPLCSIVSYADDTNVLIKCENMSNAENYAILMYQKITYWAEKNKLCINHEKTAVVVFKTSQSSPNVNSSISLDGKTNINYSVNSRMLGLRIDCHLKWSSHIQDVCTKLSKVCYALALTSKQCSLSIIRQLYFASFHSGIKYAIVHWGLSPDAHGVFLLQKRAVRIMANLKYNESCRDAFKSLKILTVTSVYIYEVTCFVYKNKRNIFENRAQHLYNTRKKNLLIPHKHVTALYQKSLFFNGCKFFNALPENIKCLPTIYKFKTAVRSLLLNKNCYSTDEFFLAT